MLLESLDVFSEKPALYQIVSTEKIKIYPEPGKHCTNW
jgi:hypothetical protein